MRASTIRVFPTGLVEVLFYEIEQRQMIHVYLLETSIAVDMSTLTRKWMVLAVLPPLVKELNIRDLHRTNIPHWLDKMIPWPSQDAQNPACFTRIVAATEKVLQKYEIKSICKGCGEGYLPDAGDQGFCKRCQYLPIPAGR